MAYTGKIARLPHDIREELNPRLRDNTQGLPRNPLRVNDNPRRFECTTDRKWVSMNLRSR